MSIPKSEIVGPFGTSIFKLLRNNLYATVAVAFTIPPTTYENLKFSASSKTFFFFFNDYTDYNDLHFPND